MALVATAALFTGAIPDATPRPPEPEPDPTAFALLAADEGGWSWFNAPNAVYLDGKTHITYITGTGHPMAAYYDHATETMSEPVRMYPSDIFEVDDHDDPSLLVRSSDGALLAYFAIHSGDDQYVNVWDGAWSGPSNIGSAINAGTTTYMAPVELPDGTIRVFFRDHYDGENVEWAYADAADGETFDGHTSFVRDPGVITYVSPSMGADGRIDFVASGHPAYDTGGSIWHFYWDDGSYYKSDGTLIESALPLDTGDMTKVYDGATTLSWHWDIARIGSDLAIVFATFPGNDGSEHRYQYARWTGSAWTVNEVADAGGTIKTSGDEVFYSGGIAIDRLDVDRVYYSSDAAGSFDIFRGITSDGGATWSVAALTSDATKDIRPKAVRDADPSLRVVWMRGTYAQYTDWDTGTWGGT